MILLAEMVLTMLFGCPVTNDTTRDTYEEQKQDWTRNRYVMFLLLDAETAIAVLNVNNGSSATATIPKILHP